MLHILILMMVFILLALSMNLCVGWTGLLNLGHIAFFGIGAYASALLTLNHVPFAGGFLGAGLLGALAGVLISFPTRKLKGDYLVLATLAFGYLAQSVFINWSDVTRGPLGLPGIPKPELFGIVFRDLPSYFGLTLGITLLAILFLKRLVDSPYGRAMAAVRDDELAAKSLGKNTYQIKTAVLGISGFLAGIAGSLFAHYLSFIGPTSFDLNVVLFVLSIVVIGGLASIKGTLLAGILGYWLPELLRFVDFPSNLIGPARLGLFSLIIIVVLLYKPKGLLGRIGFEW